MDPRNFLKRNILPVFFGGLIFILSIVGCKNDKPEDNHEDVVVLDASFAPFYERFHTDSVYQLEHINFPLQGLPQQLDSTSLSSKNFFWDKESWVIQHDFDEESAGFHKIINAVTPEMVEETIVDETGNFGIVRRFIKLDGEWYLIYFSGLGRIRH